MTIKTIDNNSILKQQLLKGANIDYNKEQQQDYSKLKAYEEAASYAKVNDTADTVSISIDSHAAELSRISKEQSNLVIEAARVGNDAARLKAIERKATSLSVEMSQLQQQAKMEQSAKSYSTAKNALKNRGTSSFSMVL